MPLLLTPAAPLRTTCLLEVASVYVILDLITFNRRLRRADFTVGYYANEAASLPDAAAQVEVNLPRSFSIAMSPAAAASTGDPQELLEEYVRHELLTLLPDASIENVP